MKISIIGAGNGGQAMAGHFALLGHQVCLYNRTESKLAPIALQKSILLNQAIQGIGYLQQVTSSLAEAIVYAELIMITTTADAHRELAEKMAELVTDGQIIILNPGRTLGAFEFASTIRKLTDKRLYIAEAQSLIYACRAEIPGQVRVIGVKERVLLAAYPHSDTDHVLSIVNAVYPCFVKAGSVLETSLENIGAILHPSVILFNAASIERGQGFYFYNDMTPAVAAFLEKIDNERLQIGKAFGLNLRSLAEWISFAYNDIKGDTLYEKIKNNPAYYKILAPQSLHSRLLLEDIPTGILPLVELGCLAGVKTPLMESVFNIAQALLKIDFRVQGRTLHNLGLDGVTMSEFIERL
jgi:opine dehydrogenase